MSNVHKIAELLKSCDENMREILKLIGPEEQELGLFVVMFSKLKPKSECSFIHMQHTIKELRAYAEIESRHYEELKGKTPAEKGEFYMNFGRNML